MDAYLNFAQKLTQVCLEDREKNICLSPLGVYAVLAAAAVGAGGQTEREIVKALGEEQSEHVLSRMKKICEAVCGSSAIGQFDNRVKIPGTVAVDSSYRDTLKNTFGKTLNFTGSTDLVLENEIDFKDQWETAFSDTVGTFYSGPEDSVGKRIPFLTQESSVIFENTPAHMRVEIPFQSNFCMVVDMPKGKSLESWLADENFRLKRPGSCDLHGFGRIPRLLFSSPVKLSLPSFKIENTTRLNEDLQKLGIKEAFSAGADFSKISPLVSCIQTVSQKANVEVTAQGAAAHALTRLSFTTTGGSMTPPKPEPLCFDHPFLFSIWMTAPVEMPVFVGAFRRGLYAHAPAPLRRLPAHQSTEE